MFWAAVIFSVFWMVVVIPWYHAKMAQGQVKQPSKQRTTTIRPKPIVNVPAPVGSWWQRRMIRWF